MNIQGDGVCVGYIPCECKTIQKQQRVKRAKKKPENDGGDFEASDSGPP